MFSSHSWSIKTLWQLSFQFTQIKLARRLCWIPFFHHINIIRLFLWLWIEYLIHRIHDNHSNWQKICILQIYIRQPSNVIRHNHKMILIWLVNTIEKMCFIAECCLVNLWKLIRIVNYMVAHYHVVCFLFTMI